MGRKLTANVLVENPETGAVTCLEAGTEVPAWATEQVKGEHLYAEHKADDAPAAQPSEKADAAEHRSARTAKSATK